MLQDPLHSVVQFLVKSLKIEHSLSKESHGGPRTAPGTFPVRMALWSLNTRLVHRRPRHGGALADAPAGISRKQRSRHVDVGKKVWHATQNTVDTCGNRTVSRPHNEPTRMEKNSDLATNCPSS